MSLQRRVALPPLALGIHPAPPPKKVEKKEEKKGEARSGEKQGEKKPEDKTEEQGKEDGKGKEAKEAIDDRADKTPEAAASPVKAAEAGSPASAPASPGSMIPEPPTPGSNAPPTPAHDAAPPAASDAVAGAQVPPPQLKDSKGQPTEAEPKAEVKDTKEPTTPPPPIRLVGPVPPRPVRTKLDLDPATPYPPINTDPRGAYYKYAKFNQGEWICIDITKDGWLSEQWREKPEREALARLRGESDAAAKREAERMQRLTQVRQVPEKADEILLQLWNDLVEAPSNECTVADFWAKYDWSDPKAQKHLLPAMKAQKKEDKQVDEGKEEDETQKPQDATPVNQADNGGDKDDGPVEDDHLSGVEWTKEGLEEILGTVGIQCSYKTAKPLGRSYYDSAGAYLLRAHGFFMLRTEDYLQFKSEEATGKFEMLVTSGHDRVFGEMVKAQQAEQRKKKEAAYRQKRAAEKKKAAEEAKKKKENEGGVSGEKEGEERKDAGDEKGGAKEETEAARKGGEKGEDDKGEAPLTPGSNIKVKDGEGIKLLVAEGIAVQGDNAVIAIPVQDDKIGDKGDDEKHEVQVVAAAPGEGTKPEAVGQAAVQAANEKKDVAGEVKGAKAEEDDGRKARKTKEKDDKRPFDPMREVELLAKMVAAGQTPSGMGMEDVKLAFRALEAAAAGAKDDTKKDQKPVIWTWHDRCEMWRWKNFEAKLHEVGPGGWEERDWKVFADNRGCDEFDEDEGWMEVVEQDVHDWSC